MRTGRWCRGAPGADWLEQQERNDRRYDDCVHGDPDKRDQKIWTIHLVTSSCFADRQQALPAALKRAFTHAESEPTFLRGQATTAMGLVLRQMLTCNLHGGVARLYLEAKLMRSDIDRLEQARHILLSCYEDPPTITELSRAVGLNRTKLKAGFKDRFGTTIFGFIRAQRMRRALLLLRDRECNVSQAAATVGYNSLSAFAAAFKVEFGFSPQLVRGCADVAGLE